MFGRKDKAKERVQNICVYDEKGAVLYEGKLEELPLKEEVILEKSMEFFRDPNPCYIHRGAVSIRLYQELKRAVQQDELDVWNRYADLEGISRVTME